MKPVLLAYGNCQAAALSAIAASLPSVRDQYEVRYVPSHPALGNIDVEAGLADRCALVWEQVGIDQRLPFRDALPPSARRIRLAELSLPLLWPFNCPDPRNVPDPPAHWGKFPYGDHLALQLIGQGYHGIVGVQAWVEKGAKTVLNIDRLLDLETARARRRSLDVDLDMTSFIFAHWRDERLFATLNHPSNSLLWSLSLMLLDASFGAIPSVELAAARAQFMHPRPGCIDMDWFQMVVHPSVAEAFGLRWCVDSTLHRCEVPGIERKLTRLEFMADYYMAP